jgi:hypothetical protein
MPTFDLSALTNAFVGGGEIFGKQVLNWGLRNDEVQIRTNVKTPQAMAKYEADGEPRPYRKDDDFNGGTFTDRVLTAYMSKYDQELDSEDLRNEYLAEVPEAQSGGVLSFEQFAVMQASKQYLAKIVSDTLYLGVRDGAGSDTADICDGWGTILAAGIIAGDTVEVATGAVTAANAVTKVEAVVDELPIFVKDQRYIVYVSYGTAEKYATHYRTLNGFGFDRSQKVFPLDNRNGVLKPVSWMGTSSRIIATLPKNFIFGTDLDRLAMHPTPHLNLLRNRIMFAAGCQIRDFDVLKCNDQA